jgi:hypothetical protein
MFFSSIYFIIVLIELVYWEDNLSGRPYATGNSIIKVVPSPSKVSTLISPP